MFDPTNCPNVMAAGGSEPTPEQHAALDRLLRSYWRPLYLFAVRSGRSHHDAQDAVQGFFASLVERRARVLADPARGRFRNFLLRWFQNFMFEEFRKSTRLKRSGEFEFVSSDDLHAAGAARQGNRTQAFKSEGSAPNAPRVLTHAPEVGLARASAALAVCASH